MSKRCYHTTPIYYVNDVPHPGHAYCTIATDALTRARRLQGHDVFFLTGTDEHGQNIEKIARDRGVTPKEHCDRIVQVFRALWERLDVRYDRFIRTTDELHRRGVLQLWSRLSSAQTPDGRPAVYRGKYSGFYCPRCEGFKDESELGQPGNLCPDHERPCEWTEEENLFFRLSAYEGWLKREIEGGSIRIEPEARRNEVLAVIRQGLQDFSVSRARVRWGIPVPEQPDHVFYVWMDALANYITALGFDSGGAEYRRYWEGDAAPELERLHLVGKEIIRFHCLYWPAMLQAAGLKAPTRVFAHGHLTKNGKKLSKSTGNTIDPGLLIDRLGTDAFRYFFLREGSFSQDWDFTETAYLARYNADLANDLGNLVSRALTMVARYCGGRVPPRPAPGVSAGPSVGAPAAALPGASAGASAGAAALGIEQRLEDAGLAQALFAGVFGRYEALDFAGALAQLWGWVSQLNQRIVQQAPWEMAKDAARHGELQAFLYRLVESLRLVAVLAQPVMPGAARRVHAMLGLGEREAAPGELRFGVLEPGAPLGEIKPLFPRFETKENTVPEDKAAATAAPAPPANAPAGTPGAATAAPVAAPPAPGAATASAPGPAPAERIDISEFAKVELRVAQIVEAEKVPGSKKLIKMQVDLGSERRQLVAGIAESYAPEALLGKKVAVVANLKPAKLMGVESNGMVLAASPGTAAVLVTFDADVPVGTRIK